MDAPLRWKAELVRGGCTVNPEIDLGDPGDNGPGGPNSQGSSGIYDQRQDWGSYTYSIRNNYTRHKRYFWAPVAANQGPASRWAPAANEGPAGRWAPAAMRDQQANGPR